MPATAAGLLTVLGPLGLDYLCAVRGSAFRTAATRPDCHVEPGFNREAAAIVRTALPKEVALVAQGSVVDVALAEELVAQRRGRPCRDDPRPDRGSCARQEGGGRSDRPRPSLCPVQPGMSCARLPQPRSSPASVSLVRATRRPTRSSTRRSTSGACGEAFRRGGSQVSSSSVGARQVSSAPASAAVAGHEVTLAERDQALVGWCESLRVRREGTSRSARGLAGVRVPALRRPDRDGP